MLVTLKVWLADGKECLLSAELDEVPESPEELLTTFVRDDEIALSDSASVPRSEVVRVEFAPVEPEAGPRWIGPLRDEDVESAMDGRFEKPPYE
jgi:hypothetical protein